jgi:hypothetical protein
MDRSVVERFCRVSRANVLVPFRNSGAAEKGTPQFEQDIGMVRPVH